MYLCTVFNWRHTWFVTCCRRPNNSERIGVRVPKCIKYAYESTVKDNKTLWSKITLSSQCPYISPLSCGTVKQEMRTGTITSCWLSDISHASGITSVMEFSYPAEETVCHFFGVYKVGLPEKEAVVGISKLAWVRIQRWGEVPLKRAWHEKCYILNHKI